MLQPQPNKPDRSTTESTKTGGDGKSVFMISRADQEARPAARDGYLQFSGKDGLGALLMRSTVDFLNGIHLDPSNKLERVVIKLLGAPAIERMKYVSQLSTASWVYPDGIHSRFPHIVGCAVLAAECLNLMRSRADASVRAQIDEWGEAVVAFAMIHDVAHIAPGSHLAHRVWFEGKQDCHEEMSHRLLRADLGLRCAVEQAIGEKGACQLDKIVEEDPSCPPFTWQMITAGGWNADRGDFVLRDSHMCGVNYGLYDVPIIKKNLMITPQGELAIREAGVSALEGFFVKRFDMYRNVYYHPTVRVGAEMTALVGKRARELFQSGNLEYADETMRAVLSADSGLSLAVPTVMNMVEYWWNYHLGQWAHSEDATLRELSGRVLRREPFKRFSNTPEIVSELTERAHRLNFDPSYFVLSVPGSTVKLQKDLETAIQVFRNNGSVVSLVEHSPLMRAFSGVKTLEVSPFVAAPQDLLNGFSAH